MAGVKKLNMARWIVALRSGRYSQTKGTLKDENGYCCLGVACNISKLGRWAKESGMEYKTDLQYLIGKETEQEAPGLLPPQVRNWLGVLSTNPVLQDVNSENGELSATGANDVLNLTFAEIADKLEAYYLNGKKAVDIVKQWKRRQSNRSR